MCDSEQTEITEDECAKKPAFEVPFKMPAFSIF